MSCFDGATISVHFEFLMFPRASHEIEVTTYWKVCTKRATESTCHTQLAVWTTYGQNGKESNTMK